MQKNSSFFKHLTIYFLIFILTMISLFGDTIKPAKAATCTAAQNSRAHTLITQQTQSKIPGPDGKPLVKPLTSAEDQELIQLQLNGCGQTAPTDPNTAPHTTPGGLGNVGKDGKMPNGELPSVANGGLIDPSAAAPGSDCTAKCPPSKLFSITASIQSAICQMQCTIINWEAGIIGWAISTVLYPALGIPTTPAAAPSGTGGTGATGGTGTGGGGGGGGF